MFVWTNPLEQECHTSLELSHSMNRQLNYEDIDLQKQWQMYLTRSLFKASSWCIAIYEEHGKVLPKYLYSGQSTYTLITQFHGAQCYGGIGNFGRGHLSEQMIVEVVLLTFCEYFIVPLIGILMLTDAVCVSWMCNSGMD